MLDVTIIPAVKSCGRNANLGQGSADRKVGLLDNANDLELLGCWVSHSRSPPAPLMFFLRMRFSRRRSATTSLRAKDSARRPWTSALVAWRAEIGRASCRE